MGFPDAFGEAKPKNILFSSDVAPVIKVLFAF
jgi:hypothetical protein